MGSGKGAAAVLRGGDSSLPETPALIVPDYPVPTGLANVGNTCYANAALQCLLSTALMDVLLEPMACEAFRRYSSNHNILSKGSGSVDDSDDDEQVLKARQARREQRRKEREDRLSQETCTWLTNELTLITQDYTYKGCREQQQPKNGYYLSLFSHSNPNKQPVVDPGTITRRPDLLSSCLRPYRQEDAHEFLRALLSTLVMNGHNRQLSSLFDGLLESAVTFQGCGHSSLTRDRYMDLSLDISHDSVKSLPDALEEFTRTEILDCDNKVLCEKCGEKQQVSKGLRLATAPSILVCHLKRFGIDRIGRLGRIHKHVAFPLRLEIGSYMSRVNKATPPPYELVGVLVHQGRSCESGHYLAYVKSGDDWFKANDSVVSKVDISTVLSQQAYILMYEVAGMRAKHKSSTMVSKTKLQQRPSTPDTMESWDLAASSEDEGVRDGQDGVNTFMSSILSACCQSIATGELCCGPPSTVEVSSSGTVSSGTVGEESASDGAPLAEAPRPLRQRKKSYRRTKRSVSSSNLKELEHEASQAYISSGIPSSLPTERPRIRTHSFSHHSDPGGKPSIVYKRRSKSARKYSKSRSPGKRDDLPPRPTHQRRHSHAPPRGESPR